VCAVAVGIPAVAASGAFSSRASMTEKAIVTAARAPLADYFDKDARALCSDFTQAAATTLARGQPGGQNCQKRVSRAFAQGAILGAAKSHSVLASTKATRVTWRGDSARVVLTFTEGQRAGKFTLELLRQDGRWRVATRPLLELVACDIRLYEATCPDNTRVVVLAFMTETTAAPFIPPAIEHVGGRVLHEYKVGATVMAQSGCLACHRIGADGNRGPGQNLTHIGAQLDEAQIERAIRDPSEPMPSFKNLPTAKFHALVRFLQLLR
jgi:Cytochrome C oxidase, cbb3-type, subunit III